MKVELDLSTEQLQELDKSLTNLLENLTDEQKMEILKSYINFQFNKLTYTYTSTWGSEREELSQFGKELVEGLQAQIKNSISDKIMDNEDLKNIIKSDVDYIVKDLKSIIQEAISKYIVDNLFNSRESINWQINEAIRNYDYNKRM